MNILVEEAKASRSNYGSDYPSSLAQSVEHLTVNQGVVGSSPTGGVSLEGECGSMVKRLRHRPFTAVTRVRFPLESFKLNMA